MNKNPEVNEQDVKNENMADTTGNADTSSNDVDTQAKSVPYERFKQVNEEKKQAQADLENIYAELVQDVPQELQDLVPADLPPMKRIQWLQKAKKAGIFEAKTVPTDSPDSKKPITKPDLDLENASSYSLLKHGYK